MVIMYMLGYHYDNGNSWSGGHPGDSEFIVMWLHYNTTFQHWMMDHMLTSAHWGTTTSASEDSDFTEAEFPEHLGWYPRVWVALNKHGNFRTQARCNLLTDTCVYNTQGPRVDVVRTRNVGSSAAPFFDARTSVTSTLIYPGTEYFWTNTKFCGWTNSNRLDCATSYVTMLNYFGF